MVSTVPSPVVTVLVLILATNRPGLVVVDVNSGMSVLTQMDPTLVRLTSVSTVYIQLMDIIIFTLLSMFQQLLKRTHSTHETICVSEFLKLV